MVIHNIKINWWVFLEWFINFYFLFAYSETKKLEFSEQDNTVIQKQNRLYSASVEEQGKIILGIYYY